MQLSACNCLQVKKRRASFFVSSPISFSRKRAFSLNHFSLEHIEKNCEYACAQCIDKKNIFLEFEVQEEKTSLRRECKKKDAFKDVHGFFISKKYLQKYTQWFEREFLEIQKRQKFFFQLFDRRTKIARESAIRKNLISGIPHSYRQQIWGNVMGVHRWCAYRKGYYYSLLSQTSKVDLHLKQDYDQIDKDVPRTFAEIEHTQPGFHISLKRILRAYAIHNRSIGYSQGMGSVAGCLLLVFGEEEQAFWALAHISEIWLMDSYTRDIRGVLVDSKVFEYYVAIYLPDVHAHFSKLQAKMLMFVTSWFMCLYSETFPFETVLRIWDCIVLEGRQCIFEFGLRIMVLAAPELLKCKDVPSCKQCLDEICESLFDFELLRNIQIMPPLTCGVIDIRRMQFRERLDKKLK